MPPPEGAFADPRNPLARLLTAYRLLCPPGSTGVPRREALGLEQLKAVLGWEFFAEWAAPESIVVRLAGTHIDFVLGTGVTGVNFFDKYQPQDRAIYSRFYGAIADRPCAGYSVRQVIVGGDEAYDYHSIYLPLAPRPTYVPIVGAVSVTRFTRIAAQRRADQGPDFSALRHLGLFDIGFGLPVSDFTAIDIDAVIAAIGAQRGVMLDDDALAARPLLGRPETLD
jgi:hypothetical protein